jgi:hypothetical protein
MSCKAFLFFASVQPLHPLVESVKALYKALKPFVEHDRVEHDRALALRLELVLVLEIHLAPSFLVHAIPLTRTSSRLKLFLYFSILEALSLYLLLPYPSQLLEFLLAQRSSY